MHSYCPVCLTCKQRAKGACVLRPYRKNCHKQPPIPPSESKLQTEDSRHVLRQHRKKRKNSHEQAPSELLTRSPPPPQNPEENSPLRGLPPGGQIQGIQGISTALYCYPGIILQKWSTFLIMHFAHSEFSFCTWTVIKNLKIKYMNNASLLTKVTWSEYNYFNVYIVMIFLFVVIPMTFWHSE